MIFSGANSYFSNSAVCVPRVDINKLKLDENNGKVITGGGQKVNLTIDSNRMISRIEVVRSDDQHNVMPSVGAVSSYVSDMRNVGGGVNLWELNISLQAAVQATRFGLGATTHQDNSGHGADASTYASDSYTSESSYTPHSYTMPGGSRSTSDNNGASGQTGTDRVSGLGLNDEYSGNQTPYLSGSDSAGSANNSRPYFNTQYNGEPNQNAYVPGGEGTGSSNRGNAAHNANRPTGATPTSPFARGPLKEFETLLTYFREKFTGSVETRNEFLKENAQKISELSNMISQLRGNRMERKHYADLWKALTGSVNTPSKRQMASFHTDRLLRPGDVHAQEVKVQLEQLSRIVNTICEKLRPDNADNR